MHALGEQHLDRRLVRAREQTQHLRRRRAALATAGRSAAAGVLATQEHDGRQRVWSDRPEQRTLVGVEQRARDEAERGRLLDEPPDPLGREVRHQVAAERRGGRGRAVGLAGGRGARHV